MGNLVVQTLQAFSRKDLIVDKAMEVDLLDDQGRIIIKAGSILDEFTLSVLPQTVYIGQPNNPYNSASDVVDGLFLRLGKSRAVGNQRSSERRDWAVNLSIFIERHNARDVNRRTADVVTRDISRGGFSFLYNQYLPEGALIMVVFDMLPGMPVVQGVVRSCRLLEGMKHCVGVAFEGIRRADS